MEEKKYSTNNVLFLLKRLIRVNNSRILSGL